MSQSEQDQPDTVAQPVTTDPNQAKDTVDAPGVPLPSTDNTAENPGVSPSDANKETAGGAYQNTTAGSTPDVSTTDNDSTDEENA